MFISYPYVDQPTTDREYSRLLRETQDDGVLGSYGGAELRGYANSTGMVTYINPGAAWIQGFYGDNITEETIEHDAGDTNPRIDRVVLRLDLSQSVADRVQPEVLKGTPASSNPAIPALTQDPEGVWEIPLYRVAIAANATTIAADDVTDERVWVSHHLGIWTDARRPTNPRLYKPGYNVTKGYWEFWDGSDWKKMNPAKWSEIEGRPSGRVFLDGTPAYIQTAEPTGSIPEPALWFLPII